VQRTRCLWLKSIIIDHIFKIERFDEFDQLEEACCNLETESDHEPSNQINIHPHDMTSQLDSIGFTDENIATLLLLEQEMDRYSVDYEKGDDNTATFGTCDEYFATFDTGDGYFTGSESGDRISTMLGGPVGEGDYSTLLAGSDASDGRSNQLAGPVGGEDRSILLADLVGEGDYSSSRLSCIRW